MFSTLRGQLLLTYGVLLVIIAALVFLWIWNTSRHEEYFSRGQSANEALQGYMHLSIAASRYFKSMVDDIVLEQGDSAAIRAAQQSLEQILTRLERLTQREMLQAIDADDRREEKEEEKRLERLGYLIDLTREAFDTIKDLQASGREQEAQQLLSQTLKEIIDQDFGAVINMAIRDEAAEVNTVKLRDRKITRRLTIVATLISLCAIILIASIGWLMLGRLQDQLQELINGTQQLASGDLSHRIQLQGPRELNRLALSFNTMGHVLEKQRMHLLQASAMLEKKVQERTAELDEANQELRRLDEARKSFFADVSHELRTPLTAIRGEAEVTLRGRDKPVEEYKSALSRIVDLAKQLAHLVDDLLLFARTESGPKRLDISLFALDQLLNDVYQGMAALAEKQGLSFSLNNKNSVLVKGDRRQLKQAFLALVDNAVRYGQSGGEINLSLTKAKPFAVVTVADSGQGIDSKDLPYVFERFYRGDKARTLVSQGAGLGLAIAKSIIDAHRGEIFLKSVVDHGTTVTVHIPLAAEPSNDEYFADAYSTS